MATENTGSKNGKKKWNVMVYLAGDNNLSEEMVYALKEMRRIGTTSEFKERARVIAQFDPRGAKPERFDFNRPGPVGAQAQMRREASTSAVKSASAGGVIETSLTAENKGTEEMRASLKNEPVNYPARGDARSEGIAKGVPTISDPQPSKEPTIRDIDGDLKDFIDETFTAENVFEHINKRLIDRGIRSSGLKDFETFKKESLLENSADPKVVEDFISSDIKEADLNLLVLSGHGSGAVGDFLPDDNPQSHLSIPKLRQVLEHVTSEEKKIDILGFDSCLMGMAEVCYEVKDKVEYVVGAEGFMLNTGWPFHRVLEAVKEDGNKGSEELAKTLVKRYTDYYGDYDLVNVSADLSAIDLEKIGSLADAVEKLTAIFNPILEKELGRKKEEERRGNEARGTGKQTKPEKNLEAILDVILRAHWDTQSYKFEQYVDLYDFSERLKKACDARNGNDKQAVAEVLKNVSDACGKVTKAVDEVVLKSCYVGPDFQHSHGLSVYFPWSLSKKEMAEYRNLKFSKKTKWGEFVENYLETTRRERRQIPGTVRPVPREDSSTPSDSKFVTGIRKFTPEEGMFSGRKVANIKNSPGEYTVEKCE